MKKTLIFILGVLILVGCGTAGNKNPVDQNDKSSVEESVISENNEESIRVVVLNLFDGVRESNIEKIKNSLTADAIFISAKEENGALVEKITKGVDFVEKAGAPHEQIWDERLSDIRIDIVENSAVLNASYEFYLGENLSHTGEMKIDLTREAGIWLVQEVWYTVVK